MLERHLHDEEQGWTKYSEQTASNLKERQNNPIRGDEKIIKHHLSIFTFSNTVFNKQAYWQKKGG